MPRSPLDSFDLLFPADLTASAALGCFEALSGILTTGLARFTGVTSMVLEVESGPSGFRHHLCAEHYQAAFITSQLRALLPGIRVTPASPSADQRWTRVVEVALRRPRRTLRASDPDRLSTSLLASLQGQKRTTVVLQWVLSPAPHERPPVRQPMRTGSRRGVLVLAPDASAGSDVITDVRDKLSVPNYLAVLRIAVQAATPAEARNALATVRTALTSVHTAANGFYARLVPQGLLRRRFARAAVPWFFPMQLSARELVALSAWPIGSPNIAGLPHARTRQLAPPTSIPSLGLVLCNSTFPDDERPLAVSTKNAGMHIHVCGPTGTGKTALLTGLATQITRQGYGLVVIESKGDLFRETLARAQKKRLDDMIVMDVADEAFPLGFNVLAEGNPRATVEAICALFEYLYRDTRSVWTRELLFYGLSTLVTDPRYTFIDLAPLLAPMRPSEEAWRNELIDSLTDPELKSFWERFRAQPRSMQDRMAQPVLDRVWQLSARPNIRNIFGQSRSSFRMVDVVREGRILLINLAGLGTTTASLAGTLLVSSLWRAVQSTPHKRPLYLLLDEFQDFADLPDDPQDMLVKARSMGLGLVMAHQNLAQLAPELRAAVLANAATKVVFQTAADDARTFAREFGRDVSEADFLNLGRFEVLAKFATDSGVSAPVTGVTRAPSRKTSWANEARTLSHERYGRPEAAVNAEIAARRIPTRSANKQLPKLGGQEWQ